MTKEVSTLLEILAGEAPLPGGAGRGVVSTLLEILVELCVEQKCIRFSEYEVSTLLEILVV